MKVCAAVMSELSPSFSAPADPPQLQKAAYPPPFSIQLTSDKRTKLDVLRGNKSLSAYIREQLFGGDAAPRKRTGNSPLRTPKR